MKWEYAIFPYDMNDHKDLTVILNVAGKDGWELVSEVKHHSHDGDTRIKAFFKRALHS